MKEPEFDSPVASVHRGEGIKVEKSVTVHRPALELWEVWRNFENLPRIMEHVESVAVVDPVRSHWVVNGPAGSRYEWDAEIHNELRGELIAWRSVGGDLHHAGSVRFKETGGGTQVIVELRYEPPAGKVGAAVAKLFGKEPGQQIEKDLERFKQVMESGEAPAASEPPPVW
jgi:uncharacterized membrane protein